MTLRRCMLLVTIALVLPLLIHGEPKASALLTELYSFQDTTRNVIITPPLYEQIQKELSFTDTSSRKHKQLQAIQLHDTLSFEKFMKLMGYNESQDKQEPRDSIKKPENEQEKRKVVITRALLSDINRKLSASYSHYDFYDYLKNVNLGDTIPFRYIEYLYNLDLYKKDKALAEKKKKQPQQASRDTTGESATSKKPAQSNKQKEKQHLIQEKQTGSQTIVFRVQVAASRVPLTQKKLHTIYNGPKRIIKNTGDGWYRYSIGHCPSYEHATRLKKNCGVSDAFEVAYKGENRLNAYQLKDSINLCTKVNPVSKIEETDTILYRVQIAASKTKLSPLELSKKYCGNHQIYEYKTTAWYKYSIGAFQEYEPAERLQKIICTPGAFVVVYKDGRNILTKTTEINNSPIFIYPISQLGSSK